MSNIEYYDVQYAAERTNSLKEGGQNCLSPKFCYHCLYTAPIVQFLFELKAYTVWTLLSVE